jgi:sulfite reductase (NADPH) flavoprotein alpha-component
MGPYSLPNNAPFTADEVDDLNRIVDRTTPTQRAWLAGFLAGIDASAAPSVPAAEARPAQPLTILFASESGNSETLAANMAKAARKVGLKPSVVDMADLDPATLTTAGRLAVIAATWGEGDPPGRVARVYEQLMGEGAPRLDGVEYGVLALGDTAYANFCAIGRALDARLAALGATRVVDRVDCDLDFADPAGRWIEAALKAMAPADDPVRGTVISVDFGAKQQGAAEAGPFQLEVSEHIDLNSSRSGKETIHIELAGDRTLPPYKPGDSLDLYAENDPMHADAVLEAAGLASNGSLRDQAITVRDITTLSVQTLEAFVAATGQREAKALLDSGNARTWLVGRQLIDLLKTFPAPLSEQQFLSVTRPLAPRAYSIASSRREVGEEVHLLIAAVRYASYGRERRGVASCFVADRLKKGDRVRVRLRPNRHFALPAPDRDIIMVGPGTGVAPFRAFIQERRATGATGRAWLFFGDRRFTHDFLYQLEWQDAFAEGTLNRMDVAFSRDGTEKVYVQDRMWAHRRDLLQWLDGGASFYVCGDAKGMAKDVRAALVRAYSDVMTHTPERAEESVRALERDRRYLQDVY